MTCVMGCVFDGDRLVGDCRAPSDPACAAMNPVPRTPEGIPVADLRVEVWPPRERGGQHVGTTSRGVRIEHLPTGTVAIVTEARSQHVNRAVAMDMIMAALTNPKF